MKRKSPTPFLPFSQLLLRPLPDTALVKWGLALLPQHHCIKDMLPIKIYRGLSDRREINETDYYIRYEDYVKGFLKNSFESF